MTGLTKLAITGGVVFIGFIVATLIGGFISGLVYAFLPMLPTLSIPVIGDVLTFLILAPILGYVILWALKVT